jgi:alginate O-acetyltransferase complex protein AlgI
VLFSWVWFRSETLADALAYFGALFGCGCPDGSTPLLLAQLAAPGKLAIMAVAVLGVLSRLQAYEWSASLTWPKVLVLVPAFVLALIVMFTQTLNPFLYFQF